MLAGFVAVALLSGLHNDLWALLHPATLNGVAIPPLWAPDWLPKCEFPWRIAIGTLVTSAIALCFRTPDSQLRLAAEHLNRLSTSPLPSTEGAK
jgi:SSS family solute:Na+ symporter